MWHMAPVQKYEEVSFNVKTCMKDEIKNIIYREEI